MLLRNDRLEPPGRLSQSRTREVFPRDTKEKKVVKVRFQIELLEERIAPTIVAVNGGGNTPNGNANADTKVQLVCHRC